MKTLEGSCLCGRVKLAVPDDFDYMGNCHCSECRKFTGSDYSSVGGVDSSKFRLLSGKDYISTYMKSAETELAFCQCCGSSLYSRKVSSGKYNIRLGILDDAPTHKPTFNIHLDSKMPWYEPDDSLTAFKQGIVKGK